MQQTIRTFQNLLLIAVPLAVLSPTSSAQTREQGAWWPHPIWGVGDQAGGTNWITPEKVVEAIRLVTSGRVYELGQVYERGMPLFGQRSYTLLIPGWPTSLPMGKNQLVYNDEFVCAEIGQVGTQFDGPGHIGVRTQMSDGTHQDVFYNGYTKAEMGGDYGLQRLGIEQLKPILTRGILLDIAAYKGTRILPNSYEVTVTDVRGALQRQGIAEASIRSGDALFFRYGWSQLWNKPQAYNSNPPGIGLAVAAWVVEKQVSMVGSDSWTTEVVPNPNPELLFPVHQELITKNGIFNLENMTLEELAHEGINEFLFILTPIRFKGATGSPARPLAVR